MTKRKFLGVCWLCEWAIEEGDRFIKCIDCGFYFHLDPCFELHHCDLKIGGSK